MFKIAAVYHKKYTDIPEPCTMDTVRWLRISEAFAKRGYQVDIVVNRLAREVQVNENLRYISSCEVHWDEYDVIKTFFHAGFKFLMENNAHQHPFIISKLGSVVGSHDEIPGVYFTNERRRELFEVQKHIAKRSRYVAILTDESIGLWKKEHKENRNVLKVPTGVQKDQPRVTYNPYKEFNEKIAVYIGNIYSREARQRDVNLLWQDRFNQIGHMLKKKGIRFCFIGKGLSDRLDPAAVTYLGAVHNDQIHNYHYYADAGIVLAQGSVQHNESSKIYDYLRNGLPVVSEKPVPNNHIITESRCGLIAEYNDNRDLVGKIEEAVTRVWNKDHAIDYILRHHTWEKRVENYCQLIEDELLCKV